MSFDHPLARKSKVWSMKSQDGTERRVLVVVTTLVLDPKAEGYKKRLVERLTDAAAVHLAETDEASDFILINRVRDWLADAADHPDSRK